MASATRPHVVIVNRNYPPRMGITGGSACALARTLHDDHAIDVSVVTVRSAYAGGGSATEPVGNVCEIAALYDGKKPLLRFLASLVEGFRLIWKARRLGATHTIVMTDPPLLTCWASVLLGTSRNWILWSMDLYPEALVAGKFIGSGGIFHRVLERITYHAPPKMLIALGPLQAEYIRKKYDQDMQQTICPCGVFQPAQQSPVPSWKSKNNGKIVLGYCGNLGEAHSVGFLQAVLKFLDPDKFSLVLSVYGSKAQDFLDYVADRTEGVFIVPNVSRQELEFIDIHLVSLMASWVHVCVPSKAVSAVCSGSTFLFCGIAGCDTWQLLGSAGWLIEENENDQILEEQVAKFMSQIGWDEIAIKKQHAKTTTSDLLKVTQTAYGTVADYVSS